VSALELPTGTVTFLFTDIEGSTKLLQELGDAAYAESVEHHRRVLRDAFDGNGGVEVDTAGDGFFVAFPDAPRAVRAAARAQAELADGRLRVRMGIHSGTPLLSADGYFGVDVHRAARIAAAGHGGQVLLSAATAGLVGSTDLTDLGLHRLKDLSAPERLYQLGNTDFPPLNSLKQTNFPVPLTPFVGRRHELAEARELLARPVVRLLTLTGAGGTGKTRLGLQVAAELSENYRDGIWWVPLSSLRDSGLVLAAAGQVVGATNGFAEHIGDRSMLILFDNFEHLVDAAPALVEVVTSCPNLDVLVTSREPLHVAGEQEYAVPPLSHEDGIDLFVARARAIRPELEVDYTVPEICDRLEDLPLALELAAARVKALSPAQILERLEQRLPLLTGGTRDLPERQRTLRATIEWSYELLSSEEQRLFARLSVFRGGCTLEAAEAVVGADLDTVQSLVDKSLLRHSEERYWMLETIREYAAERLDEAEDADALRLTHATHTLSLAQEIRPLEWSAGLEWLEILEREQHNVRAALDSFEREGEHEQVALLAGSVWRFWCLTNRHAEGRSRLEPALERYSLPTSARAGALIGAADMAGNAGDVVTLRARANEARDIYTALDEPRGIAEATSFLGQAALESGDRELARDLFQECADRYEGLGDRSGVLFSQGMLANALFVLGDEQAARSFFEAGLDEARTLGEGRLEFMMLNGNSRIALEDGRPDDALALLKEAVTIAREIGDLLRVRMAIGSIARVLLTVGQPEAAARLLSCSEARSEEITGNFQWLAQRREEMLERLREQLGPDALNKSWEQGSAMTLEEGVELALAVG
jgi:predicted ATPase